MSGYHVDLDAVHAAGTVLREVADSVSAALDHLDPGVCASLGPGRLATVAAGLTEDARRDLDRVLGAVVADADLAAAVAREYGEHDEAAANLLRRRAGQ